MGRLIVALLDSGPQARLLTPEDYNLAGAAVAIGTKNLKHLTHFAAARHWRDVELQ